MIPSEHRHLRALGVSTNGLGFKISDDRVAVLMMGGVVKLSSLMFLASSFLSF